MKKILCPTDLSDTALHTVAYAAKMAQKTGAQLTLFNIQSFWEMTPAEVIRGKASTMEAANLQLEELSVEISRVYKISCYGEVGSSNQSIAKLISSEGSRFDLIIMGTDRPDSVENLFGYHTVEVAKKSLTPLLIIPAGYEYQEIVQVAFATDYFRDHRIPLIQLTEWAKLLKIDVTFFQVMTVPYSHEDEEKMKNTQMEIRRICDGEFSFTFQTTYAETLVEGINDYIALHECDALALNTRHHEFIEKLFHKSMVKTLSVVTRYPLFIFHS